MLAVSQHIPRVTTGTKKTLRYLDHCLLTAMAIIPQTTGFESRSVCFLTIPYKAKLSFRYISNARNFTLGLQRKTEAKCI